MAKKRHTTQRDINAAVRGQMALELRKEGLTLEQISQRCGYKDKSGAFRAIQRELDRIPAQAADELRTLESLRIDQLYAATFRAANLDAAAAPDEVTLEFGEKEEGDDDPKPKKKRLNLFAVDRLIELSKARRQLHGLDTPPRSSETARNTVVVREMPPGYLGTDTKEPQA